MPELRSVKASELANEASEPADKATEPAKKASEPADDGTTLTKGPAELVPQNFGTQCLIARDVGRRTRGVAVNRKIIGFDISVVPITDGVLVDYQATIKPMSSLMPSNIFCTNESLGDKNGSIKVRSLSEKSGLIGISLG